MKPKETHLCPMFVKCSTLLKILYIFYMYVAMVQIASLNIETFAWRTVSLINSITFAIEFINESRKGKKGHLFLSAPEINTKS